MSFLSQDKRREKWREKARRWRAMKKGLVPPLVRDCICLVCGKEFQDRAARRARVTCSEICKTQRGRDLDARWRDKNREALRLIWRKAHAKRKPSPARMEKHREYMRLKGRRQRAAIIALKELGIEI